MRNPELGKLFYREIQKIHEQTDTPQYQKVKELLKLLQALFLEVTAKENIQFTTFFARIAFVFQKYSVTSGKQFQIHRFRKSAQTVDGEQDTNDIYSTGLKVVADCIKIFYETDPSVEIANFIPKAYSAQNSPVPIAEKKAFVRVVVVRDDAEKEQFVGVDEDTSNEVRIQYNIAERNENFRKSVSAIKQIFGFPITLHLLEVEITAPNEGSILRPRAFVIEPDHLVDVTAVAECFRREGAEPLLYLLHKFSPYEVSHSIMKGNIANFFLDELVANPNASFKDTFRKVFKINPLAFCLYEEKVMREIYSAAEGHFMHLKRMMIDGFPKEGILRENTYLEPSFYAPKYGLQGRLDLFYQNPETLKSAIVELKSGKPFKPNIYGISNNHFTQTLLYDLLIEAAFKGKLDPTNYILYSVLETDNLKFAPSVKAQQFEALNVRNQILAMEWALIGLNRKQFTENNIFKHLTNSLLSTASGFEKRDIDLFDKTMKNLSSVEKKYFTAFVSFVSREHQLAKVGVQGVENVNGVASLWLNSSDEKEANFNIFSRLKIQSNQSSEEDSLVIFEKTERTNPLANFRIGDIIVLYPADNQGVLNNQIFKCSIVAMSKETVTVRLRSRQLNQYIFEKNEFWNIEHDLLDSSFVGMYRSLFEFARSPKPKRDLLMAIVPPLPAMELLETIDITELTSEQNLILNKIINSKDYFLLWGPPGTGKTSMMLKNLVGYLLNNTEENILLLAYTNRAVDEICEALESLGNDIKTQYIRIGSRYSTAPQYHEQLLDFKISIINTRKELVEIVQKHRIYVATVASMNGKQELLQLKKFNRVIIDEASQILEPMLMGLLSQFDHFTLIGDHKQLPAVVAQGENESVVIDSELNAVGLKNLRNSLFERLFKRANTEGWHWAYDILSHQGRMHEDIMQFPSSYFYERKLQILPENMNHFQLQNIDLEQVTNSDNLKDIILKKRVLFLNTETDNNNFNKTNAHEARLIGELVKAFEDIYQHNGRSMHPLSIGVITPYRAQIAQIQAVLQAQNFDTDKITIDTVERYQGGARDVILLSLCTNDKAQLSSLISLSEEGVDRKLNVALTRARKHLIVVGNAEILRGSEIYKWFIDEYLIDN